MWKDKQIFQSGTPVFRNQERGNADKELKRVVADDKEKEACNDDFIKNLLQLLNGFDIAVDDSDIENRRTSVNVKPTKQGKLSSLHFVAILNIRKTFPEYGNEGLKHVLETDNLESLMTEPLFNFETPAINNYRLMLTVDNHFPIHKSRIQISIDVSFNKSEDENIYGKSKNGGIFREKHKGKKIVVQKFSSTSQIIGTILALSSSILCGTSFATKKWSLIKMDKDQWYYFDINWWKGQILMIVGDLLHFVAFHFAPAIIVCTLQIFTVIVAAFASSKMLGEKFPKYGKLAFALSLGGCWVIVFHVPKEPQVFNIDTLLYMLSSHLFLSYIVALSITIMILISYFIPKYGSVNSLSYTLLCAIFGSVIVIGLKGMIVGYTDTLSHWLPWVSFCIFIVFVVLQLEFLNKVLSIYNTLIVTTQYYVLYCAFVILTSSLLLKTWTTSCFDVIFTNICGLTTIVLGALILTIFEEENATFDFSKLFSGPEIRTNTRNSKKDIKVLPIDVKPD